MRVLVTGASGRIGKALCDELLKRGDEVVGLTRSPEKASAAQPQLTWHAWEPTLERPTEAAFEGVEWVDSSPAIRAVRSGKSQGATSFVCACTTVVAVISSIPAAPFAMNFDSLIHFLLNFGWMRSGTPQFEIY